MDIQLLMQLGNMDQIAVLPGYSSVENHLELGVLDGLTEIRQFIKNL